ncbi:MAG: hypothetical protein KIT65_10945 [Xanthobacteraceae bacterium]|nr:hypothetical protein [Xanthobacteraceae bacterium]
MTSRTTPKTILLGGTPRHEEAPAANANITPGMLLAKTSTGAVRPHNVAGGPSRLVAREADLVGGSIDDVYEYATADRVLFYHAQPGDHFYMLLEAGANVAIGAHLESNGAGALQAVTAPSETEGVVSTFGGTPIFRALEAVNNGGGDPVRIKVEAI